MLQENPALIDWDDLENENIDPLDLDELPELPKIEEKKKNKNQIKWILQFNDKHYECKVNLPSLGYFICWTMKRREKKKLRNERFTWIRCDRDGNEIFDYSVKTKGRRSSKNYQKFRYLVSSFMNDVFYGRVKPLPQKVKIGKTEMKRVKNFFAIVGEKKVFLGRRFITELFRPISEFSSNQHIKIFYVEKDEEIYVQYSNFNSRQRKCRSERTFNSGQEIIRIIKKSLKEQGLLEK